MVPLTKTIDGPTSTTTVVRIRPLDPTIFFFIRILVVTIPVLSYSAGVISSIANSRELTRLSLNLLRLHSTTFMPYLQLKKKKKGKRAPLLFPFPAFVSLLPLA
jgi:hypothetical protein